MNLLTKNYLREILVSNMSSKQSIILLNNAFETTNPLMSHQFFDNAKSIVIDRDPRDIC